MVLASGGFGLGRRGVLVAGRGLVDRLLALDDGVDAGGLSSEFPLCLAGVCLGRLDVADALRDGGGASHDSRG